MGRSTLIDVGSTISRVSLTSADVADALVTSPNQLLVHGKVPGAISMFVWNRGGSVKRYEIFVQRDLASLNEQIKTLFPGEDIQAHSNGKSVVLSGNVSRKEVVEKAMAVAAGYVEKKEDVVTLLSAQPGPAAQQVLLRVRFAEVSRSAISELGATYFTSPLGVNNTIGRIATPQVPGPTYTDLAWTKASSDFGAAVTSAEGKINFGDFLNLFFFNQKYDLGAVIRAMQQRGLFQSLAEPNLVAESGKEASFLAGGEFPVPVAQGSGANLAISVMFKEFGVRLNFTPTINGDRVHLKVKPEVSTLDFGNAVVLNGFRIPALSTRRTETEIELRNGQTFAIAGLLNNQMQSTMQKIPGIGDIPIIGYLFRSKVANKEQTELVVMITPEILPSRLTGRDQPGAAHAGHVHAAGHRATGEAAAAAGVHSAVALAGETSVHRCRRPARAGCGQDARCERARGDGRRREADRGPAAGAPNSSGWSPSSSGPSRATACGAAAGRGGREAARRRCEAA